MGITYSDPDIDSDADTVSWAAVVRASGFDTFAATPTSANLAALITDETGSGLLVFATSPTLTTPVLGVATATSINKVALTAPASSATLTIADGKTLTASNTITLTATDGSTLAIGTGGTLGTAAYKNTGTSGDAVPLLNAANTWASGQVFVAPVLGTPASGNLANCTAFPLAQLTGAGTGVLTFLATPSSANLASAVTDETGSGLLVFATSPTLTTPVLGVATATSINGLTLTTSTGVITITNGKTLSVSNTLTFAGTDSSTLNIGAGGTLGTAAYVATGTSGATIPLLNAANTWSAKQTLSVAGQAVASNNSASGAYHYEYQHAGSVVGYTGVGGGAFHVYDGSAVSKGNIGLTNGDFNITSIVVGAPTGGNKGTGTINATAVYDDNVQLTDLVLDLAASGSFDAVKYYYHPLVKEIAAWWFDPDQYAEFWKAGRHLPGMLQFTPETKPSTGESITRLTAAVETLAVLLDKAFARIKALEAGAI